jgi:GH24 family phage-related lysozyme (muramidase)
MQSGHFQIESTKWVFDREKGLMLTQLQDLEDSGKTIEAKQLLQSMVDKKLVYPEFAEKKGVEIDRKNELQIHYDKRLNDPIAELQHLDSLVDSEGVVDSNKTQLSKEVIGKLQDQTQSEINKRSSGLFQQTSKLIEAGMIQTTDEINQSGGAYFDDVQKALLKHKLDGKVVDNAFASQLITDIRSYSKGEDTNYSKWLNLSSRIEMLPEGSRKVFHIELDRMERPNRILSSKIDGLIRNTYKEKVDSIASEKTWTKAGAKDKEKKQMEIWGEGLELQMRWGKYIEENPRATKADGLKWINDNLHPDALKEATKGFWQLNKEDAVSGSWSIQDSLPDSNDTTIRPNDSSSLASSAPIDEDLISVVKKLEGFKAYAFKDHKQISIGYGTKAKSITDTITESQAHSALVTELRQSAMSIDKAASDNGWELTKAQRNALISFDFNTGAGARILSSTKTIDDLKAKMVQYNKVAVNGKKEPSKGLVRRRKIEIAILSQ